jgi:hypothetical protein
MVVMASRRRSNPFLASGDCFGLGLDQQPSQWPDDSYSESHNGHAHYDLLLTDVRKQESGGQEGGILIEYNQKRRFP